MKGFFFFCGAADYFLYVSDLYLTRKSLEIKISFSWKTRPHKLQYEGGKNNKHDRQHESPWEEENKLNAAITLFQLNGLSA